MTILERVIKVSEWLIFEKIVDSRRDLAEKLSYTESSLSQILNGKVNLSQKFIKKLSNLDSRVDFEWVSSGTGKMLKTDSDSSSVVSEPIAEYTKHDMPYEIYKLHIESEKLTKEKELELIKQNGQLIEMLKKAYEK